MHPLVLYFIKTLICSGILLGYYWLALRNKVFHHYNRFYLLAAVVLSLTLPIIKIDFWQQEQASLPVIKLLQAADSSDGTMDEIILTSQSDSITAAQVAWWMYWVACSFLLLLFIKAMLRIAWLYNRNELQVSEGISLVQTEARGTPFSFFKLIFWNRHIDLQSTTGQQILKHEIAHVQQRHSLDKIFINAVLIVFWCNPFFWLLRKELNMIHEFMADKKAVEDQDTSAFAAMILQAAYPQHRFDLTNPFFYLPIKRRLMMLTKNAHSKAGYISRLMVLPLAALVFVAFTFKIKSTSLQLPLNKQFTVVIDAGHGGKDFGAAGADGGYEKDITLRIAKKIKELNSNSNINIVLSRETDIFQTPQEKAAFINNQKADFAVSIHIDAAPAESKETHTGMSFWVAKDEYPNAASSKVLASTLIQSMEKDYPFPVVAQPGQKSMGIWILKATNCPTTLVEAGYITNKAELAFLQSSKGVEIIANNILKGINRYAANQEKTASMGLPEKIVEITSAPAPDNSFPADTSIDREKALLVVNGKKIGALGNNSYAGKKIEAERVDVNWLNPAEALAKYGEDARYGACEVNYTGKKANTTFNKDKALIVSDGKILGTGESLSKQLDGLEMSGDVKAELTVLQPAQAMAKYGPAAEYGAYEVSRVAINATLDLTDAQGNLNALKIDKQPLYIIDGEPARGKDPIKSMNAESIDRINIYKDKDAIEQYGEKGKNGVVEIFTKNNKEPLYIIEGKPATAAQMKTIKPESIDAINVLKGEEATKQYGAAGKNGVIVIKKKGMPLDKKSTNEPIVVTGYKKDALAEVVVASSASGTSAETATEPIFTTAEKSPSFPGGDEAWKKYLMEHLQADMPVKEGWAPGVYRIMVSFIVRKDGSIVNVRTDDYPGSKTAEQCVNLVRNGPKWQPALQNGQAVNCYKKQPITFVVSGNK